MIGKGSGDVFHVYFWEKTPETNILLTSFQALKENEGTKC
jgi:hypothetical protein